MKKLIVTMMLLTAGMLIAEVEYINGIPWRYTVRDGEAHIGVSAYSSAIPTTTEGEVTVPDTLGGLPVCGITVGSFWGCGKITAVHIPTTVSYVGGYAFSGCCSLKAVYFPEAVESIGDYAFSGCAALVEVGIGASLREVGMDVFSSTCTNLLRFIVSENNPFIKSVGGMIVSKDGLNLLTVPAGMKEVDVPDGVVEVADAVCADYQMLERLTIPSTTARIAPYAFIGCQNLRTIVLDGDAPETDYMAFLCMGENCTTYVRKTCKGYDVETMTWNGIPVCIYGDAGESKSQMRVPLRWLIGRKNSNPNGIAANGRPMWQCYALGLNPDDANANLRIKGISLNCGKPIIDYEPFGTRIGPMDYKVKIMGKHSLSDKSWSEDLSNARFFSVIAEP